MAHPSILITVFLCTAGTLSMKTINHAHVTEGGSITIPCLYDSQYKLNSKYWCRGFIWSSCSIIAHANSTGKWTITDYPDHNIFTVTLNNAESSNSGNYWCAVEIDKSLDYSKRLYLTVQKAPDVSVMNSSVSGHEGEDVRVQCFYSSGYLSKSKQWCRIKDQRCFTEKKTDTSQNSSVQISDDGKRSFNVLMTGLRLSDSGWYYCSVGDLQVPVQLTVLQRDNKSKTTSESDGSTDGAGPSCSTCENPSNETEGGKNIAEKTSDHKNWLYLLWIAVPLLLLLMLVLVIWRIIQKHNLSSQSPDGCSGATTEGNVTYNTVVFKKPKDHKQNSTATTEGNVTYNTVVFKKPMDHEQNSTATTEGNVTYNTVVFKKPMDHEQNSTSHPPDQDEVIYSTVKHR